MAFNTGNAPGSADPRDLSDSSGDIDEWATSKTKLMHPDRLGVQRKTWHGMEEEFGDKIADFTGQINEIVIAGGRIFPSVSAGRAAVQNGQYYYAESADAEIAYQIWQRESASLSRPVASIYSSEAIDTLKDGTINYRAAGDPVREKESENYAYFIEDELGNVALGISRDGILEIPALGTLGAKFDQEEDKSLSEKYALEIKDDKGRVALGIQKDGSVVFINSSSQSLLTRRPGLYTHQLNFIINAGQSLGAGAVEDITTEAEFDNVGFPAHSISPEQYVPLTLSNTREGSRGESPMYGTLGSIKELILKEAGIGFQENDYQLLAANNAYGAQPISALSKGGSTGAYEQCISQIAAGYSISQQEGREFSLQAVSWTQGENDIAIGTSRSEYLASELKLHSDINDDAKQITGQYNNVKLITYQTCRDGGQGTVASAQLEASEVNPHILLATPIYQFSFYDFQHIDAASSKWLGGYYGLVYKRVVIDGKEWEPLKPISSTITQFGADLRFNKKALSFDESIGAQINYGFSMVDALGNDIAIEAVAIAGADRIRIYTVNPVEQGCKVRYAWNAAINRADAYTGGCGNLRDNAGEFLSYNGNPLHNWCVIFEMEV